MILTDLDLQHGTSDQACRRVLQSQQRTSADGLKFWPLENSRACPDARRVLARYNDLIMTRTEIQSHQGTSAGACCGVPSDHQQVVADSLKVSSLEKSRFRADSRRASSLYKDSMMTLTGIYVHHKSSVRGCWKVPGTSQQVAVASLKEWPLENSRTCPDSQWAPARYKDIMMTRTRISWGIAESQWRIACDTTLRTWRGSRHRLSMNKRHRCTSVLNGDGATRAKAVTDAI